MTDFEPILRENPNGVLATKNGDKLATRVFQYLFSEGKKVYFCTNSRKAVYAQLIKDPHASFCTFAANYTPVLSINGEVVFVDDENLKSRALNENPGIMKIYKDSGNPIFKLFYIEVDEVETFSFANGRNVFKL